MTYSEDSGLVQVSDGLIDYTLDLDTDYFDRLINAGPLDYVEQFLTDKKFWMEERAGDEKQVLTGTITYVTEWQMAEQKLQKSTWEVQEFLEFNPCEEEWVAKGLYFFVFCSTDHPIVVINHLWNYTKNLDLRFEGYVIKKTGGLGL